MITIKKNTHKPFYLPSLTLKKSIKGSVKFVGNFSYKIDKQKDSNKLIGLSDNWFHHQDSIRIGWRWNVERQSLELVAIIYSNKIRSIIPLNFVKENLEYSFKIHILRDYYRIDLNGLVRYYSRTSKWGWFRYKLNPYFGGTNKAPKDFSFIIKSEYL